MIFDQMRTGRSSNKVTDIPMELYWPVARRTGLFPGIQAWCVQWKTAHPPLSEQPEYSQDYMIDIANPVNQKVYVIDDTDHSTMLLAEEY